MSGLIQKFPNNKNDKSSVSQKALSAISEISRKLYNSYGLQICIGTELEFYLQNNITFVQLRKHLPTRYVVEREKGYNQYEVATSPQLYSDDYTYSIIALRRQIIDIAHHYRATACFAPKPFKDDYGSALHFHVDLKSRSNHNIFAEGMIQDNQSLLFSINGILKVLEAAPELAIHAPADQERLIPKFLAPTHISWGGNNRTVAVRIPDSAPQYRRLEFRVASANSQPEYIIFLLLLGIYYGLSARNLPQERIYGNASDRQYALSPLKYVPYNKDSTIYMADHFLSNYYDIQDLIPYLSGNKDS